ncbi:MAG: Fe-S-binding domain-containing protein, partial [Acidimicrobiia bacterium]
MLAAETTASSFPILTTIVLVPAIGALVVALMRTRRPELGKLIALLFTGATGALSIWLLASFQSGEAGYQYASKHSWIEQWGISWNLGIDGISLFMVVLT